MLHIIIFILKIIGILLLVILGLILLLVSSVLFVPITYKVRAERKDGVIQVRGVAGWMFSALQASYQSGTYAAITGADPWDTRVETAGAKEREAEEG